MAITIMLNNYLHDLATAVFAVSAVAAWLLLRTETAERSPAAIEAVAAGLWKVGIFALAWTLAGGVVRMLAFRQYEWMEAAGRGQVSALIVKHVILVTLVAAGIVVLFRIRRLSRASNGVRHDGGQPR
jgi:hypothetical protein